MNDKKEPAFFEFSAPNTDLNNLEFNIETDDEIPEFNITSAEFNTTQETIFEIPDEKMDLTIIEKNLADEFIKNKNISQTFQAPENKNIEYENIFENAINEIENKIEIETKPKPQKTSFLKRFSFKKNFENK